MFLLKMDDIRVAAQARDIADTYPLLNIANTKTSAFLKTALSTEFDRGDNVVDYFRLGLNRLGPEVPYFMLLLKNGFVDATTPIVVKTASTIPKLDSQDATIIEEEHYKIDHTKGLITVFLDTGAPVEGKPYISVSYAHGFIKEIDTEYEYAQVPVFKDIPDWLYEAALVYAVQMYRLQKEWDKQPEKLVKSRAPTSKQSLKMTVEIMITKYLRFYPQAYQPLDF